jgi:hypothetical protein
MCGGITAQRRVLRADGRETVRRLLVAGLAEVDIRGFHPVSVDDMACRPLTSRPKATSSGSVTLTAVQ